MLGDIVSNNTRPNAGGVATAEKPQPARPVQAQPAAPTYRPAQPRPVAPQATVTSASQPAVTQAPVAQAVPKITALPPVKTKKASKIPLILTIVGVLVFIGGTSGLFIYALGGK